MTIQDRNGNLLTPGDEVRFQVHPNRSWLRGRITSEGRIRADYNGAESVIWEGDTERCSTSVPPARVGEGRPRAFIAWAP